MDLNDTVYCLACRKSMPAADTICPTCGADQNAALANRTPAAGGKASARAAGGTATAPPAVEPRTEYVPCPTCNVPVAPDRYSCGYCGHVMDDPDAQRRFDEGNSKVYVIIGAVLAVLALIPYEIIPYQLFILSMGAVVMGRVAQAENRTGIGGPVVVAMGFAGLLLGWGIRWILIIMSLQGG